MAPGNFFSRLRIKRLHAGSGILTVVGIVILAAHFFVDMLNLVLDPRLRKTTKSAKGE
jgi:ABC-type dipeptide/oligopeptide/nickel transport system permease component